MFERFTKGARTAVVLAQEEARGLRHSLIGAEHLLLGLLEEGHGPAAGALIARKLTMTDVRRRIVALTSETGDGLDAEALAAIGIDLEEVRRATESDFGFGALDAPSGRVPKGHIPFDKRAKKCLELSLREAVRLKHRHIDTGHVLLGLIRDGEGLGVRVLLDAGVDLAALREDVTARIPPQAA